ncbi:MAG: hypothetical protein AAGE59_26630 [Cyanobacteria bacterium P01_F01_bin.86]
MSVNWKSLTTKLFIWLLVEIFLSILGLDNLADYSEFLQKRDIAVCLR